MLIRAFTRMHAGGGVSFRLAVPWMCVLLAAGSLGAQENYRAQLFRDADAANLQAKENNADILAPKSYTKGMDAYLEAKEFFQRGRPVDEIREKLRSATRYFEASSDASRPAASVFAPTMAARSDALSADAAHSSSDLWTKAESLFRNAATSLENGDPRSARTDAGEAQGLYRAAELEAIKTNFLAPARELLSRADAMNVHATAPQTLERARKLANLAEGAIQQNRYDNAEARRLAEEASYEAGHAIYLHQLITQLRAQGRDLEDAFLLAEINLAKIGTALNMHIRFDAGLEPAVQQIVDGARRSDSLRNHMADSMRMMRTDLQSLRQRVATLEASSSSARSLAADQARRDEERRKHEQTVALASMMFTPEDGVILRNGSSVLLRLYGLTFAPGKSAIESQFSGLLSKVARAIKMFPNCQLTVEGHTDNGGNEATNQRVSEARAEAVSSYLRGLLPPSTPILSQGYGSSRPVTDNGSAEGRAHNRRIDIVIVPEWAIVGR